MTRREIIFRLANREDIPSIVRMLADDDLGSQRENYENPLPASYYDAFDQLDADPNHELIVAELNGEVIGTIHIIFLPSLSYQGGLRSQVESVRIDRAVQNKGIGSQMMKYAMQLAQKRGAHIMQLATHNLRTDAHRFYERLGFKSTHVGMKLKLS